MPYKDRTKRKEAYKRYYTANVRYLRSLKQAPCTDCGVEYPHYVMEFDHARGEKLFNISSYQRAVGSERFLEELAKCDVVCANCHNIRTWNRRPPSLDDLPL